MYNGIVLMIQEILCHLQAVYAIAGDILTFPSDPKRMQAIS